MTKKKKQTVVLAALLLAAALCTCVFCGTRKPGVLLVHPVFDPADPAEGAEYADCVFIGRLERRRNVGSRLYAAHVTGIQSEYPYTECTFTVLQVQKGALCEGNETRVYKTGGRTLLGRTWVVSGDPTFAEGKTYLVYAYYAPAGVLIVREPMGMREMQIPLVFQRALCYNGQKIIKGAPRYGKNLPF